MSVRSVAKLVRAPQVREGGGFIVRRVIGGELSTVGPFLMLDEMGPVKYGPGEAVGAPDHPHRGFETVTYLKKGTFEHLDSQGNSGALGPGWCQWMTAGSGVVHSEMPSKDIIENGGDLRGFQLWVNLPAKDKMIRPRYQDTPPDRIPKYTTKDGKTKVAVIAGTSQETNATIETRIPIVYLDVGMQAGAEPFVTEVDPAMEGFVYVYTGSVHVGPEGNEKLVRAGEVITLTPGTHVRLSRTEGADALIIAGNPINEPIARYGPFVMNTEEEIRQAFADYRSGKFGEISGSEERFKLTDAAVKTQKKTGTW